MSYLHPFNILNCPESTSVNNFFLFSGQYYCNCCVCLRVLCLLVGVVWTSSASNVLGMAEEGEVQFWYWLYSGTINLVKTSSC